MSNNLLNLFCLVDGEATTNAFPAEIESTKTIGDLKDAILRKKPNDFRDVDANKLSLSRVSIHDDGTIHDKTELNNPRALLSTLFAASPDDNTYIIVQRPPQADTSSTSAAAPLLSMSDVLNRMLPALRPDDVRFNPHLLLSNEESVSSALDANVYEVLNRLLSVGRIGMHPEAEVVGRPDRVYYQPPRDARVLIEIKTNRALACDDLVAKYREDMDLVSRNETPANPTWRQVHQIFGYLSHNNLRYGVLTTYHQTWFMRRDAGRIWISPTIYHDNITPTLLQCYMYLIGFAGQDHTTPPAPPSPPPDPDDDDDGDNGGGGASNDGGYQGRKQHAGKQGQRHSSIITRSKSKIQQIFRGQSIVRQLPNGLTVTVGKLYLHEFEIQEVLGEGRNGRVFRAMWGDEQVALKTCDLYKNPEYEDEMLTEVAVYEALKVLQGVCIPHIKTAGYDGGIFVVAMEIVGSPMEVDTLSHEERLKIVDHLSLIHQHGIVHNDIRPHNILVRRCDGGFQVRFIDFSLSRRTYDKHALKKEIIQLECLLWPSGRT
ncbi:hypothetical protein KI688_003197 [Linnemannia hyalina]|uniref:Protein kinase domain-containing protein n=1 Tax=Linnemannia hyalina TaxID=64524 RepID=A0A9P7XP95_9FUNG|nr:hypothetical protein KI688_003197 [Linnemannia hyalina]